MTDELFPIPTSESDALTAARERYAAAREAYDNEMEAEDPEGIGLPSRETKAEYNAARKNLAQIEREKFHP